MSGRYDQFVTELRIEVKNVLEGSQKIKAMQREFSANSYQNQSDITLNGQLITAAQVGEAVFAAGDAVNSLLDTATGGQLEKLR